MTRLQVASLALRCSLALAVAATIFDFGSMTGSTNQWLHDAKTVIDYHASVPASPIYLDRLPVDPIPLEWIGGLFLLTFAAAVVKFAIRHPNKIYPE